MRHCIEFRSGGRQRLRGVRGVHGSCCGATNGGCDGLGESLVETPGSAACHEDGGRDRHLRPRAAQISKRASVLSKEPRLRATGSTLNTLF